MKTGINAGLCGLAGVLILVSGCRTPDTSALGAKEVAPSPEVKTIEFVDRTGHDLRHQMGQWSKEGWAVLNVSKRFVQEDGTGRYTVQLSRQPPE